ncbi:Type 1 glutamine amidotransferase-like domain-containing protein [Acutalibacter sp. JLR.KK004]|uniref:Type 1 glutamine amidotransferase-like domain-containing protein n=1 Tax=Acutalibacter sp. JLR.KK004 TaxID=3112622 RepID=UPI002FF04C7E
MRVFLNGGGDGANAQEAYQRFGAAIDKTKPLLYIPMAMEKEEYSGCLGWITGELSLLGIEIFMARSGEELAGLDLSHFGGIFIGGGNTYKLLHELKESGALLKLTEYLKAGGPVFGGSAGAIILGADIDTCRYADENLAGLSDTAGIDVLSGISLLCHYGNEDEEITQRHTTHLLGLSQSGRRILALPEEDTVVLNGEKAEVIGTRPYYLFKEGQRIECLPGPLELG